MLEHPHLLVRAMSERHLTTCEVSDALIKLGSPHGGHIPGIHVHSPAPPNSNCRISGPAYTVQMVHFSDQTAPKMSALPVDSAPPKSIVVIDAPAHAKNAVWGGLMTTGAQARGVTGVVVSGRCRDLAEHRAAGFPVFARGHSTVGHFPFARPTATNVPLVIQPQDNAGGADAFPAVTVEPGDWIVADENGVVCVPKNMVDKVVELAGLGREAEARAVEDIKAGKGVLTSLRLHGCVPCIEKAKSS